MNVQPPRPPYIPSTRLHSGLVLGGLILLGTGLLSFAVLMHRMPDGFGNQYGVSQAASVHFRRALGANWVPELGTDTFRTACIVSLIAAWLGYGLVVVPTLIQRSKWSHRAVAAGSLLVLVLAVICPPALSTDTYAYTGFARLGVVHGHNPYTTTLQYLSDQGDPSVAFLHIKEHATLYGPIWSLLTYGVVGLFHQAGLWWEILGMKLLATAGLMLCACAARSLGATVSHQRQDGAPLLVLLNPFLILEGPCSGHNDLVMMGLALGATAFLAHRVSWAGWLALGASIGVKFASFTLLPFLLLEQDQLMRDGRLRRAALAVLLTFAPVVAAYMPFWAGPVVFSGPAWHHSLDAQAGPSVELWRWVQDSGAPAWMVSAVLLVARQWLGIILFVIGFLWQRRYHGSALAAWVPFLSWLALAGMKVWWFPWYFTWTCTAALASPRLHYGLVLAVLVVAFHLSISYVF